MASQPVSCLTPEQYLALDRESSIRHEYVNGETIARSGGSPRHALVIANVLWALKKRAEGKPCMVFSSDLRVSAGWASLICYPGAAVLCDRPKYTGDKRDTITNPALVVEVLSPSTTAFDRGEKSRRYRLLPSVLEYLLIDPAAIDVEHYRRLPNGNWELATVRDRGGAIQLAPLAGELPLAEIYSAIELLDE